MNPLRPETYHVGLETYRRNCPLSKITYGASTDGVRITDKEISCFEDDCEENEESDFECDETTGLPEPGEAEVENLTSSSHPNNEVNKHKIDKSENERLPSSSNQQAQKANNNKQASRPRSHSKDQPERPHSNSEDPEILYDKQNDRYYKRVKIITALIGLVVGRGHMGKNSIEKQTNCRLKFPKSSQKKEAELEIQSNYRKNIIKCEELVLERFAAARKKIAPTHFIAFAVKNKGFQDEYAQLIDKIIASEDIKKECKDKKLYLPPEKLHLTISVLRLFTDEDINRAKVCLDTIFRTKVREIMNGEHSLQAEFPDFGHFETCTREKLNVLFANVVSTDEKLQNLADAIDTKLAEEELSIPRKTKQVKLHMTVLNTKYLDDGTGANEKHDSWRQKEFIDARAIFEQFGKLNLGPVIIKEVQLCEIHSADPTTKTYKTLFSKEL